MKAAGRHQAAQLARMELQRRLVFFPTTAGTDQSNGRLVAVFSLATDITDRLVEQHRHPSRLLDAGLALHADALMWQYLASQFGNDDTIDAYPAACDPFIGFAP